MTIKRYNQKKANKHTYSTHRREPCSFFLSYFSDTATNGNGAKPWSNESPTASLDFYNAKDIWYPTWFEDGDTVNGDPTYHAMKVDYVKVWAL